MGQRKALVIVGYGLSAVAKLLFPIAETASGILAARTFDRIGKGIRDAPRDALLADITPSEIRGSGFGLRTALYTIGAVSRTAGRDRTHERERRQFPAGVLACCESGFHLGCSAGDRRQRGSQGLAGRPAPRLPCAAQISGAKPGIMVGGIGRRNSSLARCSPRILVVEGRQHRYRFSIRPIILVLMNFVYSASAYPCGVLADLSIAGFS